MRQPTRDILIYLGLACVALAGLAWYVRPALGPWPLALVAAGLGLQWRATGRLVKRTPLDPPLALFLASAAVGVWAAFDGPTAWAKFWLIVAALALYYALANLPGARGARVFSLGYGLFALALVGYFIWTNDWVAHPVKLAGLTRLGQALQAQVPTVAADTIQSNVLAGTLAAIVPFEIALFFAPGVRLVRLAALPLLLLTLAGIFLSTSRGAWLALAVVLAAWGVWAVAGSRAMRPPARLDRRWQRWLVLLAVMVALAILLTSLAGGPGALAARLPGQDMWASRASLRARALALIQDTPFTGSGLRSFPLADAAYAHPPLAPVQWWDPGMFAPHSHNLWLDIGVEQGLPGLLAFVWFVSAFLGLALATARRMRRAGSGTGDVLFVEAALAGLAVTALHGLVDDPLYASRAVLFLLVPAGVLAALAVPKQAAMPASRRSLRPDWLAPLALSALCLAALIWRGPVLAAAQADLGAVAQARVELSGAQARDWDLRAVRRAADLALPAGYYEAALARDPRQATAAARLGLILAARGAYGQAIPLLQRAIRLRPGLQASKQALAEAYLAQGRLDQAAASWRAVDDAPRKLEILSYMAKSAGNPAGAGLAAQVRQRLAGAQ